MLITRIVNKIEDVPRKEWEAVFPDVLDGYDFFKSIDESGFKQFTFRYILIYDGNSLVGVAPSFIMDYPLDTSVSGAAKGFINSLRKRFPGFLQIKTVICGIPMGPGKIGISGDMKEVVTAIIETLEEIAGASKASVIAFKDLTSDYFPMQDILFTSGFTRFDSLPSAEIDVDFKDFDEYLMRLSHKTRYDLRRKFKKAERRPKLTMQIVNSPTDEELAEIYKLYLWQVEKHEDVGFEIIPPEFFRNVSRNMPSKARFFLWKLDGRIVAFVFALASEYFLSAYYLGIDYSIAYDYHLYFLKFRDIINWCIANGIKKYDVGVTGYEPKKRLGFSFVPFYVYVKHRNRFVRPLFNMFCSTLKFENFDPVLKEIKRKMAS